MQAMARDNLNAPKTWNDIDARLPKVEISIMAPPPSSGTRDAFDSLVMKKVASKICWLQMVIVKHTEKMAM